MTTHSARSRRVVSGISVTALAIAALGIAPLAVQAAETAKAAAPAVTRESGDNRYATAAVISSKNFAHDGSVDYIYIATGESYADALSAGAAAAFRGAPLLLVGKNSIPAEIAAELEDLGPASIIVVGGTAAISDSVYNQLDAYTDNLKRVWGADRYATSMAINRDAWPAGSFTIWVATGENFPDALSASAAAGSDGAPVVLVPGHSTALPTAIGDFIDDDMHASGVKVAGGTATITPQLYASIDAVPGVASIERFAGINRYETSVAINQDAFGPASSEYAFFATGQGFADALAGGAAASHRNAPLYAVEPGCVPDSTLSDIERIGASKVVLLGGPASLSANVAALHEC